MRWSRTPAHTKPPSTLLSPLDASSRLIHQKCSTNHCLSMRELCSLNTLHTIQSSPDGQDSMQVEVAQCRQSPRHPSCVPPSECSANRHAGTCKYMRLEAAGTGALESRFIPWLTMPLMADAAGERNLLAEGHWQTYSLGKVLVLNQPWLLPLRQ